MSFLTSRYYLAAAFIVGCCFISACENSQQEIDDLTKRELLREVAINVESYMSQEGKLKAKLVSPLMYRMAEGSDTQYVEFPTKLHVDFFDDSARLETFLDSKYGKYFENQNKVYLRDSVVIITLSGDTLRCHDLWWDQNRGMFYTDTVATYKSPGNDISGGKGMEATQDLKTVTFREPLGNMNISSTGFAEPAIDSTAGVAPQSAPANGTPARQPVNTPAPSQIAPPLSGKGNLPPAQQTNQQPAKRD